MTSRSVQKARALSTHPSVLVVAGIISLGGGVLGGSLYRSSRATQKDPAPFAPEPIAERLEIPLEGVVLGPQQAPVTITAFFDLTCHFSELQSREIARLRNEYPDLLRVNVRLVGSRKRPESNAAALVTEAAGKQGAFWPMMERLWVKAGGTVSRDPELLAQQLGLDGAKFRRAMNDPVLGLMADANKTLARSLGVAGTPALFINGLKLPLGVIGYEGLKTAFLEELRRLRQKSAVSAPDGPRALKQI
jgi:protein-disulfide isomerase